MATDRGIATSADAHRRTVDMFTPNQSARGWRQCTPNNLSPAVIRSDGDMTGSQTSAASYSAIQRNTCSEKPSI